MLSIKQRPQAMAGAPHLDAETGMFFGCTSSLPFSQPGVEPMLTVTDSIGDDFPFLENAPEPAPGAPLLSATESSNLHDWFDGMKTDIDVQNSLSGKAVHSENWIDIPHFVGSTTSFGPSQNIHLGDHVLPQSLLGNMPLMFETGPSPSNMMPTMGSASRSNSTPAIPLHLTSGPGHSFMMPGGNLGLEQAPSDDVVAAASTLLLNSQNGTRHSSFNYGPRPNLSQPHHGISTFGLAPDTPQFAPVSVSSPSALLPSVGSTGSSQINSGGLSASPASVHTGHSLGALQSSGLVFAANGATAQQVALSSAGPALHRQGLQWGTDQSFAQKQFTPRSEKETSEALTNVHLKHMECLAPNHSAGTTRPSSPTYDTFTALSLKTRTSPSSADAETNGKTAMAPPRKRRKGKTTKGEDADATNDESNILSANAAVGEGDDDTSASGAGLTKNGKPRKRKAKAGTNGHPPSQSSASPPNLLPAATESSAVNGAGSDAGAAGPAPSKRRRSAALAKPPRENLTEEQKRENHIKSEQKRRTLIKTGFEDLCILVPGLQGNNLSKSLVLTTAASWLSDLLDGNRRLEDQLRSMPNGAFAN